MSKSHSHKSATGPEAFLRAYERRTKGFDIHASKPPENEDDDNYSGDEGHFSWSACDTCGSTFGGDRYDMVLTNVGVDEHGKRYPMVEVSSCVDCMVFAANGDLPDTWRPRPSVK